MGGSRKLVIACTTVIQEMLPLASPEVAFKVLDFGHYGNADNLRAALQLAVDESSPEVEFIILGYGLCSQGVIGLKSNYAQLIMPRVDDCIAIFLGSRLEYLRQGSRVPGTYYLTKAWIEAGHGPFAQYERVLANRGPKHADRLIRTMLANYTRLALIDNGQHELAPSREYAAQTATRFGLRYEEIAGSTQLLQRMIDGPWDQDFVVVQPGEAVTYEHFYRCS